MQTSEAKPTFSLSSLLLALGVGIGGGVGIGLGISLLAGWETGGVGAWAAPLSLIVWIAPAIFGASLLAAITRRQVENLGMPVLLVGFFRMLIAVGLGLGAYLILEPAPKAFWTCFLCAGLCGLASETIWSVRKLAALGGSGSSAPRAAGV
jgi:hypothetical protein